MSDRYCVASTVYRVERTTTMSVIVAPAVGGKAADTASFARSDCGLFVGFPSVVSAPPSSAPIATTATTTAATQAAIVRHGCRALVTASLESFIAPSSFICDPSGDLDLLLATLATAVRMRIGPWARV